MHEATSHRGGNFGKPWLPGHVTPKDLVLLLSLVLLSVPILFQTLRVVLFHTTPIDDYAPFLVWFIGHSADIELRAPMHYRIISVAPAVLFWNLPLISFSQMPPLEPLWHRATQAIVFWNWIAVVMTSGALYRVTRASGSGPAVSFVVGLATLLLSGFVALTGVDGPFLLAVVLLAVSSRTPLFFIPLVLTAPLVNEKLALIFLIQFGARLLFHKPPGRLTFRENNDLHLTLGSAASVGLYFVLRSVFVMEGNENQLLPATYFESLISSVTLSLSIKGVVLNVLPVGIILGGYGVAILSSVHEQANLPPSFRVRPSDILVPIGLLTIALVMNLNFNIGRIIMMLFPLLLPCLGVVLSRRETGGI